MRELIPLFVDLRSKRVVIFGGGSVGERKARLFSGYSNVIVVSRSFSDGLKQMGDEGLVELVTKDIQAGSDDIDYYLKDAFIVIPATSSFELNIDLERRANTFRALINRVDGVGDVLVPSIIRRDPITIAISTLGESPAFSRYLKKKIDSDLTESQISMAKLLGELRSQLKTTIPNQALRREILWKILSDEEIWRLLDESYEKAYKKALQSVTG